MDELAELIGRAQAYERAKQDVKAQVGGGAPGDLQLRADGKLVAGPLVLTLDEWAAQQLCAKLGPAAFGRGSRRAVPWDYLRTLPAWLRADVMNEHLNTLAPRTWLVRAYAGRCRAVLAGDYPVLANADLLVALQELLLAEPERYRELTLIRPHLDPDNLHLRLVWRNDRPSAHMVDGHDAYGVGCYVGHGEIGNAPLQVLPLVQKHACQNSLVWADGEKGLIRAHHGSRSELVALLGAALARIMDAADELLVRQCLAENEPVAEPLRVLDGLRAIEGWTLEVRAQAERGLTGATRAGLVNGITYAAHMAGLPPSDAAALEMFAGRLLLADSSWFAQLREEARVSRS